MGIFAGAGLTTGFGKRFIGRRLVKLPVRREVRDESDFSAGVLCAQCGGWGGISGDVLSAGMPQRVGQWTVCSECLSEDFLRQQDYGDGAAVRDGTGDSYGAADDFGGGVGSGLEHDSDRAGGCEYTLRLASHGRERERELNLGSDAESGGGCTPDACCCRCAEVGGGSCYR